MEIFYSKCNSIVSPNIYRNQRARGLKRKKEAVESMGGCCANCGYKKNLAALEFHHKDKNKEFQLDLRKFSNTSLTRLRNELDKCILLCSNCHKETHNPQLDLLIVDEVIKESGLNHTSFNKSLTIKCVNCDTHFTPSKGKKYCSKACRHREDPSIKLIMELYEELRSWDKVADKLSTTRRIIQRIRKLVHTKTDS